MGWDLLWKTLCPHPRIFRALKSRENGKCRSGGGQSRTSCLLGLGNERGNNRKPSKDAGLGGFANSREDRGVRKIHRKPKGPEVQKMRSKSGNDPGTATELREISIFWGRGSVSSNPSFSKDFGSGRADLCPNPSS